MERDKNRESGIVTLECITHNEKVITKVAEPKFCREPKLCAGRGYCPREYSCND